MSNSNGNGSTKTWNPDADRFRKIAQDAGFFNDFQTLRAGMEGAGYTKGQSYDEARRVYEPKLLAAMGMNGTGAAGPIGVGVGLGGNEDEQNPSGLTDKWNLTPAEMRTAAQWAWAYVYDDDEHVKPSDAPSRQAWNFRRWMRESPMNREKFITAHASKLYGAKQDIDKDADKVSGNEAVNRAIEDIRSWRAGQRD